MRQLANELESLDVGVVKVDESLKNHTTWKIGGAASILYEPSSLKGLQSALRAITARNLPLFILGRGSNVLISDEGIPGVVIKLGDQMASYTLKGTLLTVEAGCSLIKLATILSKKGYSGLEFAAGIPGSLGGAVYMNAGAHGADISSILTKALILFLDGSLKWLTNQELNFDYRTSVLQRNGGICVAAEFQMEQGNASSIRGDLLKNKSYRKETQPWTDPCCGSVFRNPLPNHAGKLIEELGLKGFSIGDAEVSSVHGNFIINKGDAKAEDVLKLIQYVRDKVEERFEIQLQTEVEFVPLAKDSSDLQ
ncbi:UDP-N-acetylmuramate dehydrogenase [Salipaludibacillus sp. CF4.18]|uniref:UDP-N-acetylmuramate dehydrogenase n=1 Tax=Salipaludibacillus sp. CF4.18 TaxID=3373081 RepID=UPI003EE81198